MGLAAEGYESPAAAFQGVVSAVAAQFDSADPRARAIPARGPYTGPGFRIPPAGSKGENPGRLQAAFGRNETLDRACQHEKQRLSRWRGLWYDLIWWDLHPFFIQPSVPSVLRMSTAVVFDLELGLHDIGLTAAVQGLRIYLSFRV